jgi:polyhydroxybutyrate depolymerase
MFRSTLLGLLVLPLACERQPAPRPAASTPVSSVAVARAPGVASSAPLRAQASSAQPQAQPLTATVHLPTHLATGQRAPLLLLLHALGTSAEDIEKRTDWASFAEKNGLAWLAPNGPVDALGRRFWDAGPSCCNFAGPPIDHVASLRALLEETLARHPIDRERVYVGGISNGGFMAHRLACAAPELVRGIVSISGAGPLDSGDCKEPKSLRVLEIHGDADPMVSYDGGHLSKDPRLPEHASAQKTATDWAARLGCRSDPVQLAPIDLEKRFAGAETRVTRYEGCTHGALELWTVTGGDHYLAFRQPAPDRIWEFLSR